MNFRRLHSAAERDLYARQCRARLRVDFPLDYLQRSQIYGLFDPRGDMVGGVLYCGEGPFRSLAGLPEGQREQVKAALGDDLAEATGLWLDRRVVSPRQCAYFFFRVWWSSLRTGKRYSVFSYSLKVRALQVLYEVFPVAVVYEGPVFCVGMQEPDVERVCVIHNRLGMLHLLSSPILKPRWFLGRVLGRASRLRRKPLARFT